MNKKTKQERIDELGTGNYRWYQPIRFDENLMTHSNKYSDNVFYNLQTFGTNKWNNYIKPNIPFDLKGKTVLDVGCNAGLFLIESLRAGASFAYGIEPSDGAQFNNGFDKQAELVVEIFSEIDNVDYSKKIKIINKELHKVDFYKEIDRNIDITYAMNVLYWLTYSDEVGSINMPEEVMQQCIDKIFSSSDYLLIVGDENVERSRVASRQNSLGCSLRTTLPFLENRVIVKQFIEQRPKERHPIIFLARR